MKVSHELYQSLIQKYESEIQEYKTTLMIYFENPVCIGDHPTHLEDMDALVANMACTNDKLNNNVRIINSTNMYR